MPKHLRPVAAGNTIGNDDKMDEHMWPELGWLSTGIRHLCEHYSHSCDWVAILVQFYSKNQAQRSQLCSQLSHKDCAQLHCSQEFVKTQVSVGARELWLGEDGENFSAGALGAGSVAAGVLAVDVLDGQHESWIKSQMTRKRSISIKRPFPIVFEQIQVESQPEMWSCHFAWNNGNAEEYIRGIVASFLSLLLLHHRDRNGSGKHNHCP